jgi:arabinan endo-1,5-alpha-L-arabinosidase
MKCTTKKHVIIPCTLGLLHGTLLFLIIAVTGLTFSCTNIKGDGEGVLLWPGATLPEETSYRNPVWEPDLTNPSVIRGATQFFAFGDEKDWSDGLSYVVPVLRSNNLMTWSLSGEAFPSGKPDWAEGKITSVSGLFAKTLSTYYLAYTIGDAGIGIAYAKAPQGPYIDYGKVIDPNILGVSYCRHPLFMQAGLKFYLFYETSEGIQGLEMNVVRNAVPVPKGEAFRIASPAFSGVFIFRKAVDRYYFFGTTGEAGSSTVKMAMAQDIRGPYLDKEGNDIVNGNGTDLLVGNSDGGMISPAQTGGIFTDYMDKEWILYQITDSDIPSLSTGGERHPLMLNRLDWDEQGWPVSAIPGTKGWNQPKFILSN